jgi:hypothetical protein
MRHVSIACLIALGGLSSATAAQESPYVAIKNRPIKALSAEEIDGYLEGRGMGFALAAELNGYPGPRHVLELVDSLGLDTARRDQVQRVFDHMHASAVSLGNQLVAAEASLDSAFANRSISQNTLEENVALVATLRGRLRTVHLAAHLEVTELLSEHELREYQRLRGYGGDHGMDHGSHQQHRPPQ